MKAGGRWFLGGLAALGLLALACAPAAAPTATPVAAPEAKPTATLAAAATPTPGVAAPRPATTATPLPGVAAAQPRYGGVLRVAYEYLEDTYWDVNESGNRERGRAMEPVMDRFIGWNAGPGTSCEDYGPSTETGLISRWEYTDDRTVVFQLRPGIRFHKRPPLNLDREIDAEDLKVNWQRLRELYSKANALLSGVESIEVRDKYTLVFHLKRFSAGLIEGIATDWALMQPRENAKFNFGRPEEIATGTGPYLFKRYVPGVEFVYERNPSYWMKDKRNGNQLPYPDGIQEFILPDSSTRMSALRTGKIDLISEGTLREGEEMARTNPGMRIAYCASNNPNALYLMSRPGYPPFDDVRVRRAVAMAIDKEAYARIFEGDRARWDEFIMNPKEEGYLPREKMSLTAQLYWKFDREAAKKLLAEAGYPKGFKTKIVWISKYGAEYQERVEFMADQLSKVGIDALNKPTPTGAAVQPYNEGYADESYTFFMKARYDTLIPTLQGRFYPGSNKNAAQIQDPKVKEYTDLIDSTADREKRLKLIAEVQNYLAEQAFVIYVADTIEATLMQPYVMDMENKKPGLNQMGQALNWVWLNK